MDPYLHFRLSLARHGLAQVAASLRGSLEITVLAVGPLIVGLLATAALPPVLAATLPLLQTFPLLLLHALAMTLPAWLLRARILPAAALDLLRALPVPTRQRMRADALVAAVIATPLALAYIASLATLLWQQPAWMHGGHGVVATMLSLTMTWMAVTATLFQRGAMLTQRSRPIRPAVAAPYAAPRWHTMWPALFWAPAWRGVDAAGPRQTLLLAASVVSAACWTRWNVAELSWLPAPVLGLMTSVLLVLLAHYGDQATRAQIAVLRPVMAAWPLAGTHLALQARILALAPSLLVSAVLAASSASTHLAGHLYLALSVGAPALLIALPPVVPRTRVAWVAAAILILSAIGSER